MVEAQAVGVSARVSEGMTIRAYISLRTEVRNPNTEVARYLLGEIINLPKLEAMVTFYLDEFAHPVKA